MPGFAGFALIPAVETLNTRPQLPYLCSPSDCGGTIHIFRWVRPAGFGLLVMAFVLRDRKNNVSSSYADCHRYASSDDFCLQLTWAD